MRGPFYNDHTGVTGEPKFDRDKSENYQTYQHEDGRIHTRILASRTVEQDGDQN